MSTQWELADDLGPDKIIHIHQAAAGLKAIVVVDNVACGPSIGGVRMAPDVSLQECFRLARAMTMKNAAAGLPHGGGKSVIFADPGMAVADKESLMRCFACAIESVGDYIVGPDMGTNEQCMGWVYDEIGRAVGLPREIGGIPLDEIGATGFGLAVCAEVAQSFCDIEIDGAAFVVQGFGSVGRHAARFLAERGARLVGAADSRGAIGNADGLDVAELIAHKQSGASVGEFPGGSPMARDDLIAVECDLWIPAARPDAIREDNVDRLKARLVVPGANIPATAAAEALLFERGVLLVPDFVANAGGVICASVEYHGGSESGAFAAIEEKIRRNTAVVLEEAARRRVPPREAAVALAEARVRRAMGLRRWSRRRGSG